MICTSTADTVRGDDYSDGGVERKRYAGIKYNNIIS